MHIITNDVALSFVALCEPRAAKIPNYCTTSERSLDNPWAQITHMSNRCLARWRSQRKNMADTMHGLEMDVEEIITTDEWVWCITLYVLCMLTISGYKVITIWIIFRWWVLITRLQNNGKRRENSELQSTCNGVSLKNSWYGQKCCIHNARMILVLYIFRAIDIRKFCYQQIAEQISLIYKYVGVVSCICG